MEDGLDNVEELDRIPGAIQVMDDAEVNGPPHHKQPPKQGWFAETTPCMSQSYHSPPYCNTDCSSFFQRLEFTLEQHEERLRLTVQSGISRHMTIAEGINSLVSRTMPEDRCSPAAKPHPIVSHESKSIQPEEVPRSPAAVAVHHLPDGSPKPLELPHKRDVTEGIDENSHEGAEKPSADKQRADRRAALSAMLHDTINNIDANKKSKHVLSPVPAQREGRIHNIVVLSEESARTRTTIDDIVHSRFFELVSATLIVLNSLQIGFETDYLARHDGVANSTIRFTHFMWCFVFAVELSFRIIAAGKRFFKEDAVWNVFDSLMVTTSIIDVFSEYVSTGGSITVIRTIRIFRLLRAVRMLRLGRVLKYFDTLRLMLHALQYSSATLAWALVLIFVELYVFAICFTQGTTNYLADLKKEYIGAIDHLDNVIKLRKCYGSMPRSLYNLYMSFTGGHDWGEAVDPIVDLHWVFVVLFLIFISITFFGVLNVVTSIFVESAMSSRQHFKDMLMSGHAKRKQTAMHHLKDMFTTLDCDGSGCISREEMEHYLGDPELCLYLESMDIFASEARALFFMLDRDGDGEVNIDEFCEGCLRLKGTAKSYDIQVIISRQDFQIKMLSAMAKSLHELIT